jgi:molecular chaperone GrpE
MNNTTIEESGTDFATEKETDSPELHKNCIEDQGITEPPKENSIEMDTDDDNNLTASNPENAISHKLNNISCQLDALQWEFLSKLKNDAHKDKLIDLLHQELQAYKSDLVKKHVQSMVVDVIKIIDDIRKLSEHYEAMNQEEIECNKLLHLLKRIPDDLEDIFLYQGVKPYTCGGIEFDASRQRILKRVDTSDASLDNKVAKSLKPGYEWGEKVIRPEIVAVYLYQRLSEEQEIGIYNE